jgi:hypothetical protein
VTAAIHQPDYVPYPGYFYKILHSDVFIFLDDAQFSTSGGHDRNLIKTPRGAYRLKIPVQQTLGDKLNAVRTKDELGWKKRHLDAVAENYRRAAFYDRAFPVYEEVLLGRYPSIAELNEALIRRFCAESGLDITFLKSSEMSIRAMREQRIYDICRAVGADTYLSGTGARAYQSEADFEASGIKLVYSPYAPREYPQLWGGFIGNLSVLDYVMNRGFDLKGI